jgi:hypothetical protein
MELGAVLGVTNGISGIIDATNIFALARIVCALKY